MAAIAAGFDFRPAQTRTFAAASTGCNPDLAALRSALEKTPGVEQVDTQGAGAAATVRIQGDIKVDPLVAAAKAAGFELSRSINYVASGPADEENVQKLRAAVEKAAGVKRTDVRPIPGGATVTVEGAMDDDALAEKALAAGFTLKTLSSAAGVRMFSVSGMSGPDDEEKLRKAVQGVSGIGEFQIMTLGDMTRLGVRGGSASPDAILAAAGSAGFELQPAGGGRGQGGGPDAERNTPPAFDERVNDDLTKVGDQAPDFELIKSDGKSKVRLTAYQGKRPVVLIFGSYT
jgi:copper chaperone CopZ